MNLSPDSTVAIVSETALFAAGCFWGVEDRFSQLPGVLATQVGYTAGDTIDPTYYAVCSGNTGHAEALQITFDPSRISYDQLLGVFWACHNPTTLNRQGPDVGSQYRSGIYTTTPQQLSQAIASKKLMDDSGQFNNPIVTEIQPASIFYPAEAYHQQYFSKQRTKGHYGPTCH
jgi:peptide-methionine (S)-S-oxide reductase